MTRGEYCTVYPVDARAVSDENRAGEEEVVTVTFHGRGHAQSSNIGPFREARKSSVLFPVYLTTN